MAHMNEFFKKAALFLLLTISATANAQLLKLVAKDKAIQGEFMFVNNGEIMQVALDADGAWSYDNPNLTQSVEACFMPMDGGAFIPVWLEKGKTSLIELSAKDGVSKNYTVVYKGDNTDVNLFLEQYSLLVPEKYEFDYSDIDDEEMRQLAEQTQREDISFEEAFRRLNQHYAATLEAAKRIKSPLLRDKFIHQTNLKLLSSKFSLNELRIKQQNLDIKSDVEYQKLLAQIDPNDEVGVDQLFGFPQKLLKSKLSTSMTDNDLTAYSLDYVSNVGKYFSNEQVRHVLLSDLALVVFSSGNNSKQFDLDKFWDAFCQVAPQKTIKEYQYVVDSKKATSTGQQCPDVTFSDAKDAPHRLSEHFGRVLFIDIWATWCRPCCAEIPYIEKHVAHYKNNDKVQFVSISIDSNKQAWLRKLEEDKPQWPQYICNKEEYKLISKQWGITGIPRFVIVNANGTIAHAEAFRPSAPDFIEKLDAIIAGKAIE